MTKSTIAKRLQRLTEAHEKTKEWAEYTADLLRAATLELDRLQELVTHQDEFVYDCKWAFEQTPGDGHIVAELIVRQANIVHAERIFRVFQNAERKVDQGYAFAALMVKFAESGNLVGVQSLWERLPEHEMTDFSTAILWAIEETEMHPDVINIIQAKRPE